MKTQIYEKKKVFPHTMIKQRLHHPSLTSFLSLSFFLLFFSFCSPHPTHLHYFDQASFNKMTFPIIMHHEHGLPTDIQRAWQTDHYPYHHLHPPPHSPPPPHPQTKLNHTWHPCQTSAVLSHTRGPPGTRLSTGEHQAFWPPDCRCTCTWWGHSDSAAPERWWSSCRWCGAQDSETPSHGRQSSQRRREELCAEGCCCTLPRGCSNFPLAWTCLPAPVSA